MKRTPLSRKTPLQARTPIRRSGRLRPVSDRRRKRDANYPEARKVCWARHEGCCARCRLYVELDVGHVHHIAGRGGADPHRQDNLTWLCPADHRWVHENPAESYEQGWMVKRNRGRA